MAVGSCVRRSQAVQVALSLHPLAVLESKVASVDHIDCASRPQSMVEVHDPSQNRSVAPANRASVHQKPKITLQSEGERAHSKANTVRPSRSAQHCRHVTISPHIQGVNLWLLHQPQFCWAAHLAKSIRSVRSAGGRITSFLRHQEGFEDSKHVIDCKSMRFHTILINGLGAGSPWGLSHSS